MTKEDEKMGPSYCFQFAFLGMIIFITVALAQTNTAPVFDSCGHDLWNMTVAATVLHCILFPTIMMCILVPLAIHEPSFVESSKKVFMGIIISAILLLLTVFILEVYYSAIAMSKPDCVNALNSASNTSTPLLVIANILFGVFDGLMIIVLGICVANVNTIFEAFSPYEYSLPQQQQENQMEKQGIPSAVPAATKNLLAVDIDVTSKTPV